jgi:arylsulfatase A-like enzyme
MIYADKKDGFIEEHGGFTDEDTHVGLLISKPTFSRSEIKTSVRTAQIAPTILEQLGLHPRALQSVVIEMTPSLPGFGESSGN